jgi:hypothetical protein
MLEILTFDSGEGYYDSIIRLDAVYGGTKVTRSVFGSLGWIAPVNGFFLETKAPDI